jgi:phosphoglycolate phosphatase
MIKSVLFDLDGTLADTAPDLADALNHVLVAQGQPALPFEHIRPVVSHGGIALIRLGFNIEPEHPEFEGLRQQLLDYYLANIAAKTTLFDGMNDALTHIESHGMNWGVVTNKPAWLTDPLMEALGLAQRAACIVSGDTLPERKPHPAPMLYACNLAGSRAHECLYIGDAERDIEAGRAAGMQTLVALFGYIGDEDDPHTWGADGMIETPGGIIDWLAKRVESGAPA